MRFLDVACPYMPETFSVSIDAAAVLSGSGVFIRVATGLISRGFACEWTPAAFSAAVTAVVFTYTQERWSMSDR